MTDTSTRAETQHMLVGLPGTGKTTFLAAMWHVVSYNEIDGTLRLVKLEGDRQYLNKIQRFWLECSALPRTVFGEEERVSMLLEDPATEEVTEVVFPDLSGETFEQQVRDRQWSVDYDEFVSRASGALLFVHPHTISEPEGIANANRLMAELGVNETGGADVEPLAQWRPDIVPTQVKLTELVQFIALRRRGMPPFRLGVVISAWDLIRAEANSPDDVVRTRLPLLFQYLLASSELFVVRYFGLSAQGGDLDREGARLRGMIRPSDRIEVVTSNECSRDISLPLKWVMYGR